MATILAMHNVVRDYDSTRMLHRNCFDYDVFDKWLKNRPEKFLDLSTGLQNTQGTCITVDDATVGAFDATMLCASNHHHVTIFINPYYIVNKKQYWTHYLSFFVEGIDKPYFMYKNEWFDMNRLEKRKKLRRIMKSDLSQIPEEDARIAWLEQVFKRKVSEAILPYHLQTMNEEQLDMLAKNDYVRIEYHGWTHGDIISMPLEQVKQELDLGRAWFKRRLYSEITYFSLPFGKRQQKIEALDNLPFVLLGDSNYPDNYRAENIHNRASLTTLY